MDKHTVAAADVLDQMVECGVIAVVRMDHSDNLVGAARALAAGGVRSIEVTMTTPGALDVIAQASRELAGEVLIGAGTVLRADQARLAVAAGADFLVAPIVDPDVIAAAAAAGVAMVPGALTPGEIDRAMQLGATLIKLFPGRVATPGYFKDVLGPLPGARLLPTGNVDLTTAPQYIQAGAVAVGVGKALVDAAAVANGDWEALTERAATFTAVVREAKQARK
ncbi:bifunctional 4-hydroxy-2-oxoglutarate aldolase/2-dehydro-3-deoxy-phosphogluconate aldolase [Cellulomonas sp. 73-92]|uniref:bifunctional 4-hydroxy-2-oxoglutarate aldolase/2-dehydro-3-deoxy-phosphogluconate aldolase n=1 Tax=Cellulomonas sp. 73-92 TaxID=1895740 RepID=UPI000AD64843|nr:bifunctional 4-hydroxy-2-oxoglutarate aldolase/2-dehydro-3-deoxy-phosphogluconate aldolase [Cellulomonas sp. 73-92]